MPGRDSISAADARSRSTGNRRVGGAGGEGVVSCVLRAPSWAASSPPRPRPRLAAPRPPLPAAAPRASTRDLRRPLRPACCPRRTESTVRICASSALSSASLGTGMRVAAIKRMPAPRTPTSDRNRSAFFSPGVGTPRMIAAGPAAAPINSLRPASAQRAVTSAVATSPTIWRLRAETLSIVSWSV
jgi:hypothetical protein